MKNRRVPPVAQAEFSFRVWSGAPRAMPGSHIHSDIEVNLVRGGAITYFVGGRFETVQMGDLAVFWAGTPHQLVRCDGATAVAWVVVPLAWFLQWRLPEPFAHALLQSEFLRASSPDAALDEALFCRWAEDFQEPAAVERQAIAALEIEARLRRFALQAMLQATLQAAQHPAAGAVSTPQTPVITEKAVAEQVERIARYLSQHYAAELSVAQIAAAVGLHPKYAMQTFKARCGISVWNYLTRLRISHAQRLLLTTDLPIAQIALESGFGSPGRFHAVFRKHCHQTPRAFRALRAT